MQPQSEGGRTSRQLRRDTGLFTTRELVAIRAGGTLRPAESVLIERYRDALAGRVLELGCGDGRLTDHLAALGGAVLGIDISPRMVEQCRHAHPRAAFEVGDLRRVRAFGVRGRFDAVVASNAIIDALDHVEREAVLAGVAAVLHPGALFIFSSHNLAYAPRIPGPFAAVRGGGGVETLFRLARVPQWIYNRRRMRRYEVRGDDYALLNDQAHDFRRLHHYVSRAGAEAELARAGLALVECLDERGQVVAPEESAEQSAELYYVARCVPPA